MFQFTISDLGEFLGKSPVTLRAWERKGLVRIPRQGNKRVLTTHEVHEIATIAQEAGRITLGRYRWIDQALKYLQDLESGILLELEPRPK